MNESWAQQRSLIFNTSGGALYLQLSRYIAERINSGHLAVGSSLPSERTLARELSVSRTTIKNAYAVLADMHLIQTVEGSGTFVYMRGRPDFPLSGDRPRPKTTSLKSVQAGTFLKDIMHRTTLGAEYAFHIGMPDLALVPVDEFNVVLQDLFFNQTLKALAHSPTEGVGALRRAIAHKLLPRRGIVNASPENVMVLTGSMQGLDLIAKLLLEPGDTVIVENPTFPGAIQTFQSHGARVVGVRIDEHGLDTEELRELVLLHKPKLLYTQPVLQNPTGVSLSEARRQELIDMCTEMSIVIVEDDAYGYFSDQRSLAAEFSGDSPEFTSPVIHLGTFSKILSPGLRVGYVYADTKTLRDLSHFKQIADLHTSTVSQLIVEGWILSSDLSSHLENCRRTYQQRIDSALIELKNCSLIEPHHAPQNGFYLFLDIDEKVNVSVLEARCAEYGVTFATGSAFYVNHHNDNTIRLSIASLGIPTILIGVKRLVQIAEHIFAEQSRRPRL